MKNQNRVKIFKKSRSEETGTLEKVEIGEGTFCEWGCDFEEFESGPGNYSTAIIRMDDGTVKNLPCELIRFVNLPKIKQEE